MTIPAFKVTLGYAPKQGARALPFTLNFNALAVQTISQDFFAEQSQGEMEFFQSVFIDNSLNAQGLSIKFAGLQQIITVRTQMQGYFPIIVPNAKLSLTATTTGNVNIPLIFLNIFVNPSVWQAA